MRARSPSWTGSPRPLAIGPDWLVLPFVDAAAARRRPIPCPARCGAPWPRCTRTGSADGRAACPSSTRRGGRRCATARWSPSAAVWRARGNAEFADAERALLAWRAEPAITDALARMPRTLVHGDAHRGNVLGDAPHRLGQRPRRPRRPRPGDAARAGRNAATVVPRASRPERRLGRRARPRPVPRLRRRPPRRRPGRRDDRDGRRRPLSVVCCSAPSPRARRRHPHAGCRRTAAHAPQVRGNKGQNNVIRARARQGSGRTAPVCALVASAA